MIFRFSSNKLFCQFIAFFFLTAFSIGGAFACDSFDSDGEGSFNSALSASACDSDMDSGREDVPVVSGHILHIDSFVRREIFEFIAGTDVRSALNFASTCKQLHKVLTQDVGTAEPMLELNHAKFWKALYINYIGQKSGHYSHFNAFHRQALEESGLSVPLLHKIILSKTLKGTLTPIISPYFRCAEPRTILLPGGGVVIKLRAQGNMMGFLHPSFLKPHYSARISHSLAATQQPVHGLDLSNAGLVFVPHTIQEMTQLRTLDLSHNKLHMLPGEIVNLSLKSLNVAGNSDLKGLPQGLGAYQSIEELYVDPMSQYDGATQALFKALKNMGVRVYHVPRDDFGSFDEGDGD